MAHALKKVSKKTAKEIADRFEEALDRCAALDPIPFHIKREIAEDCVSCAVLKIEFVYASKSRRAQ